MTPRQTNRSDHAGQPADSPPRPHHASEHPAELGWRARVARRALALSWVLNGSLLVAATVWIYADGGSRSTIEYMERWLGSPRASLEIRDPSRLGIEVTLAKAAVAIAAGTLVGMFVSLFVGAARFRSLRAWLLFTAIAGGWLGLVVGWPAIHWAGQARRAAAALPAIASLAEGLRTNWPMSDDERPDIGSFLAYPKSHPATLLPLASAAFPGTNLQFSAVERTDDEAIRFELSGRETGVWVERRPDDSEPQPFVSGLEVRYRVARRQRLAPGWFLVRYRVGDRDPNIDEAPRG